MPSCSIGFCVAITMNGFERWYVVPSTVTWASAMDSSSADCVFGDARLISSASRMLLNTGPGRNSNSLVTRFHTVRPTTSVGRRSGVNCRRPNVPSIDAARALARLVLPTPGTSSMRRWPWATRHRSTSSMTSGLPWMTRSMLATTSP